MLKPVALHYQWTSIATEVIMIIDATQPNLNILEKEISVHTKSILYWCFNPKAKLNVTSFCLRLNAGTSISKLMILMPPMTFGPLFTYFQIPPMFNKYVALRGTHYQ